MKLFIDSFYDDIIHKILKEKAAEEAKLLLE